MVNLVDRPAVEAALPIFHPIAAQKQQHDWWCWAAVSSILATYAVPERATDLRQCDFASIGFPNDSNGTPHCCNEDGFDTSCDRPEYPPFVPLRLSVTIHSKRWPSWGRFKELLAAGPLGLQQLNPLVDSSHIVVVSGAHEVDGDPLVETFDPYSPGTFWWRDYSNLSQVTRTQANGLVYYAVRDGTPAQCTVDDDPTHAACAWSPGARATAGTAPAVSAGATQGAPQASAPFDTSEDAAKAGALRVCLLGEVHPASVGFTSVAEATSARGRLTTERYDTEEVRTDSIFAQDPRSALATDPVGEAHVYLLNGDKRGFMEVVGVGGKWRTVSYGAARQATELQAVERRLPTPGPARPVPPAMKRVLVRVPALRLYFLKVGPRYYPLQDSRGLSLRQSYTVQQLRTGLKLVMPQKFNGKPF